MNSLNIPPRAEHAQGCENSWSRLACQPHCRIIIASLSTGIFWEWQQVEVAKDTQNKLWFRAGSGCSCSDISDFEWEPLYNINDILPALRSMQDENQTTSELIGDLIERAEFRMKVSRALSEAVGEK